MRNLVRKFQSFSKSRNILLYVFFPLSRHISGFEIKNNGTGKSGENLQLGMSKKYATLKLEREREAVHC